jgi:AcrR family transcriptional regulator
VKRGKYKLKRRAERQEETRLRIARAAVELHGTVGPSKTTISALAEKAGVGRPTVYSHFPDELSLFKACSSLFLSE